MTTQRLTRHQVAALKEIKSRDGGFSAHWCKKSWPVLVELGLATERHGANKIQITQAGIEWLRANQ